MVVVHPVFDPTTKTWCTDDGAEADSLRALKQMLPAGSKIVGYYPHGSPPTQWPNLADRESGRGQMRSNYAGPKRQLEAHKIQKRLAAQQEPELLITKPNTIVSGFQSSGRVKGQSQHADGSKTADGPSRKVLSSVQSSQTLPRRPTQKVKQVPLTWEVRPKEYWTDKDDKILRSLAMKGDSAAVIGMVLKVTRNAVIGRAHRIGVSLGRVRT
jgi:hypothetical protein